MSDNKPHLLFISPFSPLAPFSGAAYRALGTLQWLVNRFSVDLVFEGTKADLGKSFIQPESFGHVEIVSPCRGPVRSVKAALGRLPYHHRIFSHPLMGMAIHRLLREKRYSLIWLAKSVYHPLISDKYDVPFVIDQHAAEPTVWDNLLLNDPRWYAKLFFRWNKSKVLRYDKKAYEQASGIICISRPDFETTERFYPGSRLIYIPQGVDPAYYRPDPTATPDPDLLLFTGTGAIRNVQAVKTLVKEIMPLVHKRRPEIRFLWIGNVRREEYPFLNKPWIGATGFVDHVPPHFDRGMIYVAPFDMGEGMKTKIIEAMAMGKVIVSTPTGVLGIEVEDLPFVKICSDPEGFADAILALRENPDLPLLGTLARQHALKNYSWDTVLRPLEPFLDQCMLSGAPRP